MNVLDRLGDPADVNAWLNFVLHAVYGKMAQADGLMDMLGDGVRRVAERVRTIERRPVGTLYRGVLVDPSEPMTSDTRYTFMSWTQSLDVACWFASPESVVSEYVRMMKPKLRGYVLQLDGSDQPVLFDHRWGVRWDRLAHMHPDIGAEGARQITWALRTQQEIITPTLARLPIPVPVENVRRCSVRTLDARYAPPWIKETVDAV